MLETRLNHIRSRIRTAALKAGRKPDKIGLVAVSKSQSEIAIRKLYSIGQITFGENRVQEAMQKMSAISEPVIWHLIGHLQSNKVRYIINRFELIHSVDSCEIGQLISQASLKHNSVQKVLLQVNVSGEKSKFGFDPDKLPHAVEKLSLEQGLEIIGLMTIPPFEEKPEASRKWYVRLRELSGYLREWGWNSLVTNPVLSMGMSNDFEVAVEEGATLVRIGTALFSGT